MGIGALLNRFTPEESGAIAFDKVRELVGISMPEAPTLSRVLFEYEANGLILGLLIFATALYIRGVVALARRGDKWPVGRTISLQLESLFLITRQVAALVCTPTSHFSIT